MTCTLEDCLDVFVVTLQGQVPNAYVLEATSPDGTTVSATCNRDTLAEDRWPAESDCQDSGVVFIDYAPEEVKIRLLWEGREFTQTYQPTYEITRPNGSCDTCKSSSITVLIPAQE